MGASARWTLVLGIVLLAGVVVSSPIPRPNPAYDARLSTLELAIIKCIVETVPGVTKGGGGSFEWSVVQSMSKELQGAEVEVIQVRNREPNFSGQSGQDAGDGYPDDWNIVRSVTSQLENSENGEVDSQRGFSDNWTIQKSISTELHLDAKEVSGNPGSEPVFQPPEEQTGREHFQAKEEVTFSDTIMPLTGDPSAMAMDIAEDNNDSSQPEGSDAGDSISDIVDVRLREEDSPSEMVMDISADHRALSQPEGFAASIGFDQGISEQQESSGISGTVPQQKGSNNFETEGIGWSIVRSISSEQEPIEDISSSGSHQTVSTSEPQAAIGDTDSYDLVQPISTELQPADSEAGGIPTSLTEIFPPPENLEGGDGSWNNPLSNAGEPSEVYLPDITETTSMETQMPCEKGHRRNKNICQKVHTFQLKSHLR